jgi:hypothetical protein
MLRPRGIPGLFLEHDPVRKPVPSRIDSGAGFFGIMFES